MYIYTEYYEDSTKHFGFWDTKDYGMKPLVSYISLEAEMVFADDEAKLIKMQEEFLEKVISSIEDFSQYNLYVVLHYGISSPISLVSRYKKLWKRLDGEVDFNGFVKGKEIEIQVSNGSIFCGLLKFEAYNIEKAVKVINESRGMYAIIASKSELIGENEVREFFDSMLLNEEDKNLSPEAYKINYRKLCLNMCKDDGLVVRLGNAVEEVSFAVFLNEILFNKIKKKINFGEILEK